MLVSGSSLDARCGGQEPPRQKVWKPALIPRAVRLLFSEPVNNTARKTEGALDGRAETGGEILRREFEGHARGQVVFADDAGGGGESTASRIEQAIAGSGTKRALAIGVAGEVAVGPAAHDTAGDRVLGLQVKTVD